jgi:hypothetical protein
LVTSVLLIACVGTSVAAYLAPAYTSEQPLRRVVRAVQDDDAPAAIWEIASVEPGVDLNPDAPSGWMPVTTAATGLSVPWGRYAHPFVFRTTGPALGPAPVTVAPLATKSLPDGTQMTLSVVPRDPGLMVSFVLPSGLAPARSNLPGVESLGRWVASIAAAPAEGVAFEASFRGAVTERLAETRVKIVSARFPGGSGWQMLPGWLPQTTAVWSAEAIWILPVPPPPAIAPVPPLR